MSYTNEKFRELALKNTDWVEDILEKYNSKKEYIKVKGKCGHICTVSCKDLCRTARLHSCPECRRLLHTRFCKCCGKKLIHDQYLFCSRSCSAKYNNPLRIKKKSSQTQSAHSSTSVCLNCGKSFNGKHKFCSQECSAQYRRKEHIKIWKNAPEKIISTQCPDYIRCYLVDKYNNSCQRCGWHEMNPVTGNVPLEVHHVNGDPTDNREENLQLLCPNCHALTETYKSLNKNSTRKRY